MTRNPIVRRKVTPSNQKLIRIRLNSSLSGGPNNSFPWKNALKMKKMTVIKERMKERKMSRFSKKEREPSTLERMLRRKKPTETKVLNNTILRSS